MSNIPINYFAGNLPFFVYSHTRSRISDNIPSSTSAHSHPPHGRMAAQTGGLPLSPSNVRHRPRFIVHPIYEIPCNRWKPPTATEIGALHLFTPYYNYQGRLRFHTTTKENVPQR